MMFPPPSIDLSMSFENTTDTPVRETLEKWRAFLDANNEPFRKPTEMDMFHRAIEIEEFLLKLVEDKQITSFEMESIDIFGDVTFELLMEPAPTVPTIAMDVKFDTGSFL